MGNWYARPVLYVRDIEQSVAFYAKQMGFTENWRYQNENKPEVAQVARQGCELILSSQWPEKAGRGLMFLSLMVDELHEFRRQLEKQGTPVEDGYWGYPLLSVRDPDGNIFYFAYPKEKDEG